MLPEILNLPDRALVERMYAIEARSDPEEPAFAPFDRLRGALSREAWRSLTEEMGCDNGPLAQFGVMTFPLDEDLAARLLQAMLAAPRARMRRKDFALGYVSTGASQCDYLNQGNHYRKLTSDSLAAIGAFLSSAGPIVEATIGHPYRIASLRQFQLVPNRPQADRHLDGWPVAIRKIFILPQGCGQKSSTTWFRRRDGVEMTVESDKPMWMLFENSVVLHAPVSGVALRPTIELDIVPARQTSLEPFVAGLGGWYPHFPTEAELHKGTRAALEQYFAEVPGGMPETPLLARLGRSVARAFRKAA